MPGSITVNPAFTPPAPPEQVTGPDGILTARVDAERAGVHLRADFSTADVVPAKLRFFRGDGTRVRSGDPSDGLNALCGWAPGGIGYAYDHEATPGQVNSYYAVPLDAYGVAVGEACDTAAVNLPWTVDNSQVWVKSPAQPNLSAPLDTATFEEDGRPSRNAGTDTLGATLGLATFAPMGGLSGTLTVKTDTREQYDAMLALLDSGPLLIQAHPVLGGIPDMYAYFDGNAASLRRVATGYGWGMREWPVHLVQCRRPATLDAPLVVPGDSYAEEGDTFASYQQEADQVPSYEALLGWGA